VEAELFCFAYVFECGCNLFPAVIGGGGVITAYYAMTYLDGARHIDTGTGEWQSDSCYEITPILPTNCSPQHADDLVIYV
jgi:hypothetical protein